MHFGRSHARSKSRSPAPGSPTTFGSQSSRPPTFLPPSHYAEAAGLVYGKPPHNVTMDDLSITPYPVQPSSEESSLTESTGPQPSHFGTMDRLIRRVSSKRFTVSLTRSESKSERHEKEKELRDRQNHFADIPLLETTLLPSLRDTVDRMTQPRHSRADFGDLTGTHSSRLPHSVASTRNREETYGPPPSSPLPPRQSGVQQDTLEPSAQTSIPRFNSVSSPRPKSALKSPARHIAPMADFTPTCSRNTPRSTYSHDVQSTVLLDTYVDSRVASARQRKIPLASSPIAQEATSSSRLKSKFKPTKFRPKSNPSTPQTQPRSSAFVTPQPTLPSSPFPPSSLPRPRIARFPHLSSRDSGSELERQVDKTLSPGRLVVTNAIIVPSSSESDDGMGQHCRSRWSAPRRETTSSSSSSSKPAARNESRQSSRLPTLRDASTKYRNGAVGLGLKVNGVEFGRRAEENRPPSFSDDESVLDEEFSDNSLLDEPVLFPLAEDDGESIYEDDSTSDSIGHFRSTHRLAQANDSETRRQKALLGLVDGLRHDYCRDPDSRLSNMSLSESTDNSIQGLAISDSRDLRDQQSDDPALSSLVSRRSRTMSERSEESAYSDTDAGHDAKPDDRSRRSLRITSNPWRRPSTALGVHELEQPPALLPESRRRRRSISPRVIAQSPRSNSSLPRALSSRSASPLPSTVAPSSGALPLAAYSERSTGTRDGRRSQRLSVCAQEKSSVSHGTFSGSYSPRSSSSSSKNGPEPSCPQEDAGVRERLAFGIPDSISFCGSNATTPDEEEIIRPPFSRIGGAASASSRPGLPRADSDASIADERWQERQRFSKELSKGAAALFETLASKSAKLKGRRQRAHSPDMPSFEEEKTPVPEPTPWMSRNPTLRSPGPAPLPSACAPRRRSLDSTSSSSRSSSPESVYDEPAEPLPASATHLTAPAQALTTTQNAAGSWQSTVAPDVYQSLSKRYGPVEMERQELIHNLSTSDREFTKSARHVIRTCLLPLRTRDCRTWLPGLPAEVCRLFDWLEDIVNLHAALARALTAVAVAAWKTGTVVQRVAGTLRAFVPQLEVYMPYLVKVDGARDVLRWHVEHDEGEFGEYLRMKERERSDGEWTLQRLVDEPVKRLNRFLEALQRLWELTPREHPDHVAMVSLLYSARMAVRVMEEVKAREEEYDFVKDLSSRIDGFSSALPLARRTRRLLWCGALLRSESTTDNAEDERRQAQDTSLLNVPTSSSPQKHKLKRQPAQRASRLATAVRDWDARRSRNGSSSSSLSSALSVRTDMTSSTSGMSVSATPRLDYYSSSRTSIRERSDSSSQSVVRLASKSPLRAVSERGPSAEVKVMVFTDVVVLTTPKLDGPESSSDVHDDQRCRLLDGVGLSRILEFVEHDGVVTLHLISVTPEQLDTGLVADETCLVPLTLSIPARVDDEDHNELLHALRKCQYHTVRSLSLPTGPDAMMEDLEIDTRQSLIGILSSGLPLPKSPSIQFDEAAKGQRQDVADGEREERGWWTLRFHQVLREMQRSEVPISLVPLCPP